MQCSRRLWAFLNFCYRIAFGVANCWVLAAMLIFENDQFANNLDFIKKNILEKKDA